MHPIVKDEAAPKTGGTTNQCSPNRRIPFRARNFKIRIPPQSAGTQKCETNPIPRTAGISPAFSPPNMQNEPNSPYRWHLAGFPTPKYAKRTEFPAPPASRPLFHPQICETNPIYRPAKPQICETNPISATADLRKTKNVKRTQFRPTAVSQASPHPQCAKIGDFFGVQNR